MSKLFKGLVRGYIYTILLLLIVYIPIGISMSCYDVFRYFLYQSRPAVAGIVSDVLRGQGRFGKSAIASVTYPAWDGGNCFMRAWFATDEGLIEGAEIAVVPALSRCGTPWFPEHVPPTVEGFATTIICGIAGFGASLHFLHILRKRPENAQF